MAEMRALKKFWGEIGNWWYDSNGDPIEALATDTGILKVDVTSSSGSGRAVEVVPVPDTLADVWAPGLAATAYLDVEFEFVNITQADDVLEKFGIDYGNSGALEHYLASRDIPVRTGEVGPRIGPFKIWGDDAIMAEAATASTIEMIVYVIGEGTAA